MRFGDTGMTHQRTNRDLVAVAEDFRQCMGLIEAAPQSTPAMTWNGDDKIWPGVLIWIMSFQILVQRGQCGSGGDARILLFHPHHQLVDRVPVNQRTDGERIRFGQSQAVSAYQLPSCERQCASGAAMMVAGQLGVACFTKNVRGVITTKQAQMRQIAV